MPGGVPVHSTPEVTPPFSGAALRVQANSMMVPLRCAGTVRTLAAVGVDRQAHSSRFFESSASRAIGGFAGRQIPGQGLRMKCLCESGASELSRKIQGFRRWNEAGIQSVES